ncbi:BON domain-containing protein [Burkholderia sp. AU19243]|uniref:BON domain-containing protein n=1 Tax=Burkholderia TaxID=32008 RepID=UPI0008415B98|nr:MULTISPECIES: BON domain-containing protein [Burkholderia]MBR8144661.1 BON domain-containing protein [Burkholderia vietnamiensis]AOK06250.1 transporter [Burkholderia latens]MBR8363447.1 BON domain-containing protein [Burkholderia sp. AU19243]MBY4693147.1 BON domain-containing protein [Burkholderia latens]MCA8308132.1 BON domain-containing protein [Burkholderia sp. AU28942]
MKLRHIVVTGGLAVALLAGVNVRAFADERPDTAAADAAQTSTPAAGSSKKAVRAANRTFSRSVQKALSRTKGLEGTPIVVFGNASTGRVTLTGQVDSEDQDHLAVDAARKVRGVTSVNSKITLRAEGGA